jgi:redox-sensitive bicupin YhaK (pirin superfamily)
MSLSAIFEKEREIMAERKVARIVQGRRTMDGAGVRLTRVFGFGDTASFDPFLLLDAFGSDKTEEYIAGFPWHPHRGIETVTYMLEGRVRHGDSMGNSGEIGPGDLQWMTAGSGIIHEEMPLESPRGVHGFQLWVNLPKSDKMGDPAYRGVLAADVPHVGVKGGEVLVITGSFGGVEGPITGIVRAPTYLDLHLDSGAQLELGAPAGETAFLYVYGGGLSSGGAAEAGSGSGLLFGEGDSVSVAAGALGARCIFFRGRPLRESVAWRGPIVMNTEAELDEAFDEIRRGGFVKMRGVDKISKI